MRGWISWLSSLLIAISLWAAFSSPVFALTGVHPTGVNVNTHGTTTVFLTFQGTEGQISTEAFWCGDITVPANTVTSFDPCVPGTLYGFLPQRLNLSQRSGTRGVSNTTDIMTIPASVARRAYQDAARGERSAFFYVRKFTGADGDRYVAVTCRLAGGGARVPLALTDVRIRFQTEEGDRPIAQLVRDGMPPPVTARIHYNGSGRLKGRWEVMMPGDPEPTPEDLLTEATLPVERRGLQQRYTVIDRFDVFLTPTGRIDLPGPDPARIPTHVDGPYKILLRVEATADKEGDSVTLAGVATSGGVAGFPMPVLRYFVSPERQALGAVDGGRLHLLRPLPGQVADSGQPVIFAWQDTAGAVVYELSVISAHETVLSAMLRAGTEVYTAPPWLADHAAEPLRWRVRALSADGRAQAASEWRSLGLQ